MDMESTGTAGSGGATLGGASLDMGSPLEALADAIGEALGLSPEPGSAFTPSPSSAPQWQIEAGS
jgi:hypothetical protein